MVPGNNRKILNIFISASILVISLSLISYAIIGSFTRLATDDYCIGWQAKQLGIIEGISYRYYHGAGGGGRYSYALISLLVARIPQNFYPWLSGLTILFLLLSVSLFIYNSVKRMFGFSGWGIAALIAGAILISSFYRAPNLFQVLYWKVGTINYSFPILLLFFYLSWLTVVSYRKPQNKIYIGISLLSAFLIDAFNEALLAVQGIILFIWGLIEWLRYKNSGFIQTFLAGFIGSIISALTIYFAPSTFLRQSAFPIANRKNIFQIISRTLALSYRFIINELRDSTLLISLLVLVGICLAIWITERSTNKITYSKAIMFIALASLFCALAVIGIFAAGVVGLGIEIPDRTKFIPLLILYFYLVIIGTILGLVIPRKVIQNSLAVFPIVLTTFTLCVWFNVHAISQNYQNFDQLQTFAREWDTRDL